MTSLEGNSDRDIGDDDYRSFSTFNCYEFSRYMQATHKGALPHRPTGDCFQMSVRVPRRQNLRSHSTLRNPLSPAADR